MATYKISVIGSGGAGKTVFLKRLTNGLFDKRYIATLGVDVTLFSTMSHGTPVFFNFWDCAGQEKFSGLQDGYYVASHLFLIMIDATSNLSLGEAFIYAQNAMRIEKDAPIIFCLGKCDIESPTKSFIISQLNAQKLPYYEISSKTGQGVENLLEHMVNSLKIPRTQTFF